MNLLSETALNHSQDAADLFEYFSWRATVQLWKIKYF